MSQSENVLPKGAKLLIGFKTPREPPVFDDHSIYSDPEDALKLYEKTRSGWGNYLDIKEITIDDLEKTLMSPKAICHRDKQLFISELRKIADKRRAETQ